MHLFFYGDTTEKYFYLFLLSMLFYKNFLLFIKPTKNETIRPLLPFTVNNSHYIDNKTYSHGMYKLYNNLYQLVH